MGKRQKEWARKRRAELIAEFGGCCNYCKADADLTFDCIYPMNDGHGRLDTSARMSYYNAQHRAKNLQLLCRSCNLDKSNNSDWRYPY